MTQNFTISMIVVAGMCSYAVMTPGFQGQLIAGYFLGLLVGFLWRIE